MTPEAIITKVRDALNTWGGDKGARVSLARDPFDVLELLTVGPMEALICLSWGGDELFDLGLGETDAGTDDDNVSPAATQILEVTVGQGLGLNVVKDWRLIAGKGNRPGVLARVNAVRAHILSLLLPNDETTLRRFSYRGCDPWSTPDGVPLAAFKLKFGLVAAVEQGETTALT
jgi:hypothetical protein